MQLKLNTYKSLFCLFLFTVMVSSSSFSQSKIDIVKDDFFERAGALFLTNTDSAIVIMKNGRDFYSNAENWEKYIECNNAIASCLYHLGRYSESLEMVKQNRIQAKGMLGTSSIAYAGTLNNYAAFLSDQGLYDDAISIFFESSEIERQQNNQESLAANYANIGENYASKGDYELAISYLKKCLELRLNLKNINPLVILNTYNILSNIYFKNKDYENAIDSQNKAIDNFSKNTNTLSQLQGAERIETYMLMAEINLIQNDFSQFEENISNIQKLEIENEIPPLNSSVLLGDYALKRDDPFKAKTYYTLSLELAKKKLNKFKFHPKFASILYKLGKSYEKDNNLDLACNVYSKALDNFFISNSNDLALKASQNINRLLIDIIQSKANCLFEMYKTDQAQSGNKLNEALVYFDLMLINTEKLRREYNRQGSKENIAPWLRTLYEEAILCYLESYKINPDVKVLSKITKLIESCKSIILSEAIELENSLNNVELPDSLLLQSKRMTAKIAFNEKELYNAKIAENDTKIQTIESNLFTLYNDIENQEKYLEKNYSGYNNSKYIESNISIERIKNALPDSSSCILNYFIIEHQLLILNISKETALLKSIHIDSSFFNDIESLRYYITNPPRSENQKIDYQNFCKSAFSLHNTLLSSLDIDKKIKKLTIIPDGILWYIPFEVLLTNNDWSQKINYKPTNLKYCLNYFDISYGNSIQLWELNKGKTQKHNNKSIIYTPEFENINNLNLCSGQALKALTCAEEEGHDISLIVDGILQNGESATRESFLNTVKDFQIIHLATHACLNDENPMLNRIFLANGEISNYDLYQMNLNAELAVLSACNTGSGKLLNGEGVLNLNRGFSFAGCPSTLISLWSLDDCVSKDIITNYYTHLKNGLPKDLALKRSKVDFLKNTSRLNSHPFYWSPFVQYGSIDILNIKYQSFSLPSGLLMAIILLVILYFGLRYYISTKTYQNYNKSH